MSLNIGRDPILSNYLTSKENVSLGLVQGTFPILIFGVQSGIAASTESFTLWPLGRFDAKKKTAPNLIQLSSSSALDTGVTVNIEGLDENGDQVFEDVVINGTTPVLSTGQFTSVNFMIVTSLEKNDGRIYVTSQGDPLTAGVPDLASDCYDVIESGKSLSSTCQYTVPNGKTILINDIIINAGSGGETSVEITLETPNVSARKTFARIFLTDSTVNYSLNPPLYIREGDSFSVITSGGSNRPAIDVSARGVLYDNDIFDIPS